MSRPTSRWQRRLGWLLLLQALWLLPLLLRGPWRGVERSADQQEGWTFTPLPAAPAHRSRPASLADMVPPGAPETSDGGRGENGGAAPRGTLLLNRPGPPSVSAEGRQNHPQPRTPPPAGRTPGSPAPPNSAQRSGAASGGPSAAATGASPSALLGGSLGLEDLRRAAKPQNGGGSSGPGNGSGKPAQP